MKLIDKLLKPEIAHAHCDIPCGIYDPHLAQVSAHTVIRMVDLINALPNITDLENTHKFSRYVAVKEEHAEQLKREIRVLWGDYFKPEHVEKFPELPDLIWKVLKLGSKVRQEIDIDASNELLQTVQKIADIFWKTKGLKPTWIKAPYPSGGEIVIHE
ncbi:MAG: superoxide dismutase, Ni [Candidatus Hodarchaeales archaeon]|jgi:nickel superoxide dismutase